MSTAEVEPVTYAYRTPEGTWRVAGSRVSLDSIIDAHLRGADRPVVSLVVT